MSIPSLLRLAEHKALSSITLSGRVLDLGGDKNSEYLRFLQGTFTTTTLNMSEQARPDILHDLEKPLPVQDGEYDHALLMNVLEHVFEYRQLLQEAFRAVKTRGTVSILVPFLFPIHPSPQDYHRFTGSALQKELELAGATSISVVPLAGGVLRARYLLIDRLMPKPLRLISFYSCRYLIEFGEVILTLLSKMLGKKYQPETYALGYLARATK
jgi:SAM-dependent methyltransferase